ncbi:hypothetical protein F4777DRAFT_574908 [Nemania sp. FL0916]|nr:hypothetical protein F4777DRAFT_574908 [Nemania sp. FL0916]
MTSLPNHTEESSTTAISRGFECTVPDCGKVFRRKEHLTRHLKSHDTELQYECHICGRRYARSDVLKRHVEFHPQYFKPRRNFVACVRCRESKTKCDEESPCGPCRRRALPCVRANGTEANTVTVDGTGSEPPSEFLSSHSSSVHTLEASKLYEYVAKDPATTQRRLNVYFTEIYPSWPLVQPSSIIAPGSPSLLVAAIMMLASWLEGDLEHMELQPLVFDEIAEKQLAPNLPLPILQAMAIYLLYSMFCLTTDSMAPRAIRIHNALVAACRFDGIFASHRGILNALNHSSLEDEQKEPRHRLAFAVLRLDAYLSILTDFPPLIRYQELCMPLSQSTCWVSVSSEEERRSLMESEPPLRRKTAFSFRVHDLFGVPRSNVLASPWTKMDYHFILCAIQSGAWEAAHQAVRTVPDDIHSRTHPLDLCSIQREYLGAWMSGLEKDSNNNVYLRREYLTTLTSDPMAPQTLLLWHMTNIKLQAPPELWSLPDRYYKLRPGTFSRVSIASAKQPQAQLHPLNQNQGQGQSKGQTQTPQQTLRPWQSSRLARVAVWHSAQIARIAEREFELQLSTAVPSRVRLCLNPLLIPALLMSATVVCAFAFHARGGCPMCVGSGTAELVRLFAGPEGDDDDNNDNSMNMDVDMEGGRGGGRGNRGRGDGGDGDADSEARRLARWLDNEEGLPNWGVHVFGGFPVCRCCVPRLAEWFRALLSAADQRADAALRGFLDELKAGIW